MRYLVIILSLLIGNFVFAQNQDTIHIPDLILSNYIYEEDTLIELDTTKVYEFAVVPEKPEYYGGEKELLKYFFENIKITDTLDNYNISKIYFEFVIERNGKVTNPRIIRGGNNTVNREVIRVINSLPDWQPGKINGIPVKVKYIMPIIIDIK